MNPYLFWKFAEASSNPFLDKWRLQSRIIDAVGLHLYIFQIQGCALLHEVRDTLFHLCIYMEKRMRMMVACENTLDLACSARAGPPAIRPNENKLRDPSPQKCFSWAELQRILDIGNIEAPNPAPQLQSFPPQRTTASLATPPFRGCTG